MLFLLSTAPLSVFHCSLSVFRCASFILLLFLAAPLSLLLLLTIALISCSATHWWVIPCQINTKKPDPFLFWTKLREGVWSVWKLNHTKFQQCTSSSFRDTAIWSVLTLSTDFGSACYYESACNFWCDWRRTISLTYLVTLSMLFHLIYNLL